MKASVLYGINIQISSSVRVVKGRRRGEGRIEGVEMSGVLEASGELAARGARQAALTRQCHKLIERPTGKVAPRAGEGWQRTTRIQVGEQWDTNQICMRACTCDNTISRLVGASRGRDGKGVFAPLTRAVDDGSKDHSVDESLAHNLLGLFPRKRILELPEPNSVGSA